MLYMNFFFNISNNVIKSDLTIPRFKNNGELDKSYMPFKAIIKKGLWHIEKAKFEKNKMFYVLDKNDCDNEKIIFLAKKEQIFKGNNNLVLKTNKLSDLNNYTDTMPDFRSNLRVRYVSGGFSSYQSEYPYKMVTKKGQILSPLFSLLNKEAETNFLFLRNIYFLPVKVDFKVFFVDIKKNEVVGEKKCITNVTNIIPICNNLIHPNIYLLTDQFIGIPIFCSIINGYLSLEHTHPPHQYLLSTDKFEIINNLKGNIFEIIKKNYSKQ